MVTTAGAKSASRLDWRWRGVLALPAACTHFGRRVQAFLQPNNGVRTFPAGGHGAVFLRSHMTMYIFRHNSAALLHTGTVL